MEENFRKYGWLYIIILWILFIIVELSLNSHSNNLDFKLEALFTGLGFGVIFKEIHLQKDDIDTQKQALSQQIKESELQTTEFKRQNELILKQIEENKNQRNIDKLIDTYFHLLNDINDFEMNMDKVLKGESVNLFNKPFRRNTYLIIKEINEVKGIGYFEKHKQDINRLFGYDIINYCIKLINLFNIADNIESQLENDDFSYVKFVYSLLTPYHKLAIYLMYHNQSNFIINRVVEDYIRFDKKDFEYVILNDDYLNKLLTLKY